ncbi:hypothetical protein CKM354_001296900 [Cercospora kikuchii]|uniref:Zn(2)-C6 fungal-type domain-containing protein n=1 Tax=Cercospora kikuchii TaxID=84275 RepID=A0A9P3FMZ2_9PEZI|nr:uncharacterized protein CKM354_001296900 [Cercospora kikuchii]GIZ49953.1 hypothetical protein CKM354_001296900 [Cercospora kikuchii]
MEDSASEFNVDSTHPRAMSTTKDYKRRPGACQYCRAKKFKCDGRLPRCQRCESTQQECIYRPCKKRGRRSKLAPPLTIDDSATFDTLDEWWWPLVPPSASPTQSTLLSTVSAGSMSQDVDRLFTSDGNDPLDNGIILSSECHDLDPSVAQPNQFDVSDDADARDWHCLLATLPHQVQVLESDISVARGMESTGHSRYVSVPSEVPSGEHGGSDGGITNRQATANAGPFNFAYLDIMQSVIHSWRQEGHIDHRLSAAIGQTLAACPSLVSRTGTGPQNAPLLDRNRAKLALEADADIYQKLTDFCHDPFRGARCISRASLMKIAEEVFTNHDCIAEKVTVVHAVVATSMALTHTSDDSEERNRTALAHYRQAFAHAGLLQCYKASALAFKIVAACHWSPWDVDQLLDMACSRAQALRAHLHGGADDGLHKDEDVEELRHAFWLLYSIEKPARMQAGFVSASVHFQHPLTMSRLTLGKALNDNFFTPELPCSQDHPTHDRGHEFLMHIRLAQACSQVLDQLYSRTVQEATVEQVEAAIATTADWITDAGQIRSDVKDVLDCNTRWTLYTIFLYIHRRSLILPAASPARQRVEKAVSTLTFEILESLVYADPLAVHREPTFLRAALTAFCVSAWSLESIVIHTAQFRQLGFALGFFARLARDDDFALDQTATIFRLVQERAMSQVCSSKQ